MSIVSQITKRDGEIDYAALATLLNVYEDKLEGWEEILEINHKKISNAIIEQPGWAAYYDQIRADLDILVTYFDIMLDKRAEELYVSIKAQSGYNHSETSIKRLIMGNAKYIELRRLRLAVMELKETASVISSQFYQRAFTLKSYIKVIELAAQDIVMSL